jgi:hypothetical protein
VAKFGRSYPLSLGLSFFKKKRATNKVSRIAHGRADLRGAAFVSEQTSQNFRANVLLVLSQRAVDAPLLGCRQTMSESVLVAGAAGFAGYAYARE